MNGVKNNYNYNIKIKLIYYIMAETEINGLKYSTFIPDDNVKDKLRKESSFKAKSSDVKAILLIQQFIRSVILRKKYKKEKNIFNFIS